MENKHGVQTPYEAYSHNKWNRIKLRGVKVGTVVKHRRITGTVAPKGCALVEHTPVVWDTSTVLRVLRSGCHQYVNYTVPTERCVHHLSVRLSAKMLTRARRDNRLWSSGRHQSPAVLTERHVVSPATYKHLLNWIYSPAFLEPLKATEQATQRNHCFAVREAIEATFGRYKEDARKENCEGVSMRVYKRVLGNKIFTQMRKDHCMCSTCLRSGWRGVWDNGRKLIKMLDSCPHWPIITEEDGTQTRHLPGKHLTPRLKRLWEFLRLQVHMHVESSSDIGAHCMQLKLGSLAEPRFNNSCNHGHFDSGPPNVAGISTRCCQEGCNKRSQHHCRHCVTSFCRQCLSRSICTAEELPSDFPQQFVCPKCSPAVERKHHQEGGCATCDEVHYFKLDLTKVARSTGDKDIIGRAEGVCEAIDTMVAHAARMVNQVLLHPNPIPYTLKPNTHAIYRHSLYEHHRRGIGPTSLGKCARR